MSKQKRWKFKFKKGKDGKPKRTRFGKPMMIVQLLVRTKQHKGRSN